MKKVAREIRKNLYKVFYEPTSDDYAIVIISAFCIGLVINALIR